MRCKVLIISVVCICFCNCSLGQFNTFINNFKECTLPFVVEAATFDIYHSNDDRYVISEKDVVKYLMTEGDTFTNIKESPLKSGYHKYIAVCKFDVYNDFLGVLYFRTINSADGNIILELMLCVFTTKGKLISACPISGYNTAEEKVFYSTIFSEENIEILFYGLELVEDRFGISYQTGEDVIDKKYLYITKEGVIQQK